MTEMRAIKRLVKNLETIKTQVGKFTVNTALTDIETNTELLADEWKEFQSLEKTLKGKFEDTNIDAVEKLEAGHFALKQELIRWAKRYQENHAQHYQGNNTMEELLLNQSNFIHEISNINKRENEVRLPRVNIPTFSGEYSEFTSFRDLFESSIHNNCNIPKVHKLQYLKGLLKGEALSLVNHITVTEANYDEVWEKIKARYYKRKHVVHALLKQFKEQPVVTESCAKSIRHLTDVSDEVIRGLKVLGEQAETRDPWIIYMLLNKLDNDSKTAWAHETSSIDFPTLDQLFKFLNKRSDALESLDSIQRPKPSTSRRVSSMVSQSTGTLCPLCSGEHYLGRCESFMNLTSAERKQIAIEKHLCFNCLSSNHPVTVCRSRYNCRICRRRHHFSLHPDSNIVEKPNDTETSKQNEEADTTSFSAILKGRSTQIEHSQAILPTACVLIADKFGQQQKCRALLDSGSQCSFISENCMQRLQIERQRSNVKITGIAPGSLITRGKTSLRIGSLYNSKLKIKVNALIINQLPSKLPSYNFDVQDRNLFDGIELADPDFDKAGPIDILIGADIFFEILENGQRKLNSTILQKTVLGWIVSGQPKSTQDGNSSSYMALNIRLDVDIDETLRRFWEIDETPNIGTFSPEDNECEEFYKETHRREENGRYIVRLPFKKTPSTLGNSLIVATKRFLSIERKLANNRSLREQYINQIREYIDMGHMSEIPPAEHKIHDSYTCYLPHHSVSKETSSTTKVRVVFDGSSKTSNGISLNDKLMVGPTIQPTLWTTLMRFRGHRIAMTADIEKMYRQVLVAPQDTNYQRVLWRESSSERLRHYKLNRVTFGLACSAHLAIRTLQQLARDVGDENIQSAIRLKDHMINVLRQGGFTLRKWRSNAQALCDAENEEHATDLCNDGGSSVVMVLGLHWHPHNDVFTFKVRPERDTEVTKREVISQTSRIFDPLGFLAPSIILVKILYQRLWFLKLDWDDNLPEQHKEFYKNVRREFIHFQDMKIPRFSNHYGNIQIHGFADASEVAYCAVVYSRTINEDGKISINLLTSKTKVAPVKRISLPRLELCAAHLLAKLMSTVKDTIAPNAICYAWTDSSIVLAWLSTYPARWKTFVANRTSQILEKFPRQHWGHVKSADNPADHGSRGVTPQKLVYLKQWWHGPDWLYLSEDTWCEDHTHISSSSDESALEAEMNKTRLQIDVCQVTLHDDWINNIFERKSKLLKIIRVVAYVKRYIANLRTKNAIQRSTAELQAKEIEGARTLCVLWVQNEEFRADIAYLRKNKTVNNKSNLLSLAPFIDEFGVLRVGGRLFNADSDYESKHPIILPSNHVFTERLIWEVHSTNLHAGPTLTNNLIRQKYWIVKGRTKVRSIIKNCVTCTKYARRTSSQLMGNLPAERITLSRPFVNCGIDFAGPLQFATKKGRGATKPVKGYLCIFVCLSIKAVHIEPVSDLTSEEFLAALKRFTARRGVPKNIYTDNGTNFIGARRILADARELIENINQNFVISEFLSDQGIEWHLIPPSSPHFGGLWESAVKSVKTHLLKTTNNVNLTFEEMATLLCQIENILNSRPLYTTSTDDEYEVLTPAHFLIGTSTGSIPEKHITSVESTLTRWQRIQARIQTIWKKYHIDYLNSLQQRHKWQKPTPNIEIGDIVLLKEDDVPVCKWPLGRIVQVHPGDDGRVRAVTIKTSSSILKRPIVKLCKLPVG